MKKKPGGHFAKFTKKKSNAAIKEQFKQEKRAIKKEREEYFEKKKQAARAQFARPGSRPNTGKPGDEPAPGHYSKESLASKSGAGARGKAPAGAQGQYPTKGRAQAPELMPLNKFIAHAGICSRRDAAELIKEGQVKVNNELVTEPGHKVSDKDEIKVNGKKIFLAKELVYILLNKPKDYITTTDDPQKRKTVLDLIRRVTNHRVYPIGRLDRNTSGVLLLTNDGELAQKLSHPSNEIKKVYAVTLNKPLEKKDFEKILAGITLEDGPASVDVLAYADSQDKTQVGVEIHSGRNRIVRRIFEHLGYDVKGLDRVVYAGLTKKNVERGKWRFLSEKEVRDLKYFGKGK